MEVYEKIMNNFLTDRFIYSAINSLVLVLVIPIMGYIINVIKMLVIRMISKVLGQKFALFIANYLSFIGVVHHELSHALFGLITGAKIHKVSIFHPEGDSLGKVEMSPRGNFIVRAVQLTMAAIAPVVMGTVTEYLLYRYAWPALAELWQKIILVYIMISVFLHMTMSNADIKNAVKGLPICFLIIFVVVYLTNFNIMPFTLI